jgi:peptide/nickel transport system substrate-binding protein
MALTTLNRRQILIGASVLGASTVAAMSSGKLAWAAEGKILKVQNDQDIAVLDPANRNGWWEEMVMFVIFNGLCQFKSGKTWAWQLDAAQTLEQVDPTTIKFTLKPGIMWTNGFGEMTSEDVKFSYERIADPKANAGYQLDWAPLKEVEIVDKYSGIIHLTKAFPPLFNSTLPHGSGLILCKAAVTKHGGAITTDPLATSGPYKIKEWIARQKLTLERNELWKGPQPYFDEIQLIPIADLKTAEIGYDSGDLDVTKVSISSIPQLRSAADPKTVLTVDPALAYTWLGMNIEHPKLKDLRVRRAIQQAIDVNGVLQAAYFGEVTPAFGSVPPSLDGHRTKNIYPYDPAASKKLLADAGVIGLKLRLDFNNDTDLVTMGLALQAQLKVVGIDLTIHPMDSAAFDAEGTQAQGNSWKDMQIFIVKFTTSPDPSWTTSWFTCSQVGVWNWQRVCDKSYDTLNDVATYETDPAKRIKEYVQLQDKLEESGAYLFLDNGVNAWISKSSIKPAWTPDGQWLMFRDTTAA